MNVLLISANTERINMPVVPLGMACVARAAENAGHQVTQLNMMENADPEKILKETIHDIKPELIGISVRNIDDQASHAPKFFLKPIKDMVSICRKHSQAKIVLGGAGYSIFPGPALTYLGADMGIQGEGERSFVMLLDRLEKRRDVSNVPGLYAADSGVANRPTREANLDAFLLPRPGKHLRPAGVSDEENFWLPFQTRRGCPMNCSYCSTAGIEGKNIRKRNVDPIIASISEYISAGFRRFFFVDNTFNLPPGFAKTLCEAICAANLNFQWRCILYPWKVDETLVTRMARAGCVEASLGFESGSNRLLQKMNKRYRTETVRQISNLLKSAGIRRMGFLLLGGPGESRETVRESLHFAAGLELEMVKITVGIRIYPHTALAEHARQRGKISKADALLFPKFYIEDDMAPWIRETVAAWMKDRPNWIY